MEFLRNITVLALEQATVLPYLTFRLAQDGMTVIRMEHPVYGDPNRLVGENVLNEDRMNSYYLCINAGKKAITLDLSQEGGQEIFRKLIKGLNVDIFATQQLPRNYRKLGIDYESVRSIKEDIIWLGITGFGPDSNEAAYDPILQARSGLMEMTGEEDGTPQVLGIPLPDMGTSEHAYGLLMKALLKREKTGEGSRIDVSMFESSVSWLTVPITMTDTFGKRVTRRGNIHEFFAPVSVYETKDGYVYLAIGNDRQWRSIVSLEPFRTLDRPEYEKNAGRIRDVERLNRAINEITKGLTSGELVEMFKSATVPVSKINRIEDVIREPLVQRRLIYSEDQVTGMRVTHAPPPYTSPFLEENQRRLSFPPRFGEHNREILTKLGYGDDDIKRLKEKGVI
ncbi:MAG: CoA transferase [Deltaproteobacteria bacterium]|nr:CoA transferase [Deltaproteobacteria bacterium]